MSTIILNNCRGGCPRYAGLPKEGSSINFYGVYRPGGTITGGDNSSLYEILNGKACSFGTNAEYADGTTYAPSTPTVTTRSFTCTSSRTFGSNSGWLSASSTRTINTVVQGCVPSGYGQHYGLMWFSGLTSAISGKTITSATLTLTRCRETNGRSAKIGVYAYATSTTSASGTPNVSTAYGGLVSGEGDGNGAAMGETVTCTVTDIVKRLASTGSGGIVLYTGETSVYKEGKSYSRNYGWFYGSDNSEYAPVLTVTYQ